MADVHNQRHERPVSNLVDDAAIPHAQPEKIGTAGELDTSRLAGVLCQRINGFPQAAIETFVG